MNEIKNYMKWEIEIMSGRTRETLKEVEENSNRMISNARKGIWINNWLDVVKYGLGTAVFVVPVYISIKSLLNFVGISIP
ncbi:hypothetical protein BAGA_27735 [Bacillus gaemokensis]|uniref:Uncharacterized protein n=2 Tax=Bacillus gaemokensis TaxID=574375 RepID=A0A073K4Z8_9BACI|nr:hypothetical protein BAGA_27735 [Bacillus gaemokensis]